ncbi:MAG: ribonuclease III [Deltaproteobacteria bacterium]|nr:ribonuclease III [Deltaproteobacteria bacterium]
MQLTSKKELENLASTLSYTFNNIHILENALVHRSFLNEKQGQSLENNERLEFLGDAILSTVVSHLLIKRFPVADEGRLSKFRAKLVNENALARLAMDMGLGKYLLLGKGEEITGGREKPSILSDAYEAVIAAVYLDGGFEQAFSLVAKQFSTLIEEVSVAELSRDYKTELQERTQELFKAAPKYQLMSENGPEHNKIFDVEVIINSEKFGRGQGRTKKEAEQQAAMETLERLKRLGTGTGGEGPVKDKN